MEFTGRYVISAPPMHVWAAINDPEILRNCIPGCERMVKIDDTHFEAAATIKIGPVKATFKGNVTLVDLDPPHRLTLKGEGQGGVAGFARGEAEVTLTPEAGGTALSYAAKASIGGKLAQIGQRLVDGAAKQIADDFFTRFAAALAPATASSGDIIESAAVPEASKSEVTTPEAEMIPAADQREGVAPEIWVVGLIAVVVILLVLFGVAL